MQSAGVWGREQSHRGKREGAKAAGYGELFAHGPVYHDAAQ